MRITHDSLTHSFESDEVIVGFAFADDFEFGACDEDFGGAEAGVVVAGHSKAISSCGKDGEQITSFYRRNGSVVS